MLYLLASTMVIVLGFRPDGGVVGVALSMALVVVFALGMRWI